MYQEIISDQLEEQKQEEANVENETTTNELPAQEEEESWPVDDIKFFEVKSRVL